MQIDSYWFIDINYNFLNTTHLKRARIGKSYLYMGTSNEIANFKLHYMHSNKLSYSSTLTIWVCCFLFSDCNNRMQ